MQSPASIEQSPPATQKQKRRYGQSCEVCRRQKKRCDGKVEFGACSHCAKHRLECVFPSSGEKSRLDTALARSDQLEHFVRQLAATPSEQRDAQLEAFAKEGDAVLQVPPPAKRRRISARSYSAGDATSAASPIWLSYLDDTQDHNALDYGMTIHSPGDSVTSSSTRFPTFPEALSEASPGPHGGTLPSWLRYCIEMLDKIDLAAGFDAPQIDHMLESFFSFHNPRFRLVDRNLFGRSVQAQDRRFCSPFLIASILAFTLKYAPLWQVRMEELCARAHILLAQELAEPAKLTTVQGLLILANYHANLCRKTLCMQHIGMASALLTAYAEANEHMPVEEQALHGQLQWTAFNMSVYMKLSQPTPGKHPTVPPRTLLPEQEPFVPGKDLWKPTWLPGEMLQGVTPANVQPSYEHATFAQSCKFSVLLNSILSRTATSGTECKGMIPSSLHKLRDRLIEAEQAIPPHLVIDCNSKCLPSPPLHILLLNMFVRVCWMLLYQSRKLGMSEVIARNDSQILCRKAADAQVLFAIGYKHYRSRLPFLLVFGVLHGAVVDLDRLRSDASNSEEASAERTVIMQRLERTLEALRGCSSHLMGIDAAIAMLQKHRDATLHPVPTKSHSLPATISPIKIPTEPVSTSTEVSAESLTWLLNWTNGQAATVPLQSPSRTSNENSPPSVAFTYFPFTSPEEIGTDSTLDVGAAVDPLAGLLQDLVADSIMSVQ